MNCINAIWWMIEHTQVPATQNYVLASSTRSSRVWNCGKCVPHGDCQRTYFATRVRAGAHDDAVAISADGRKVAVLVRLHGFAVFDGILTTDEGIIGYKRISHKLLQRVSAGKMSRANNCRGCVSYLPCRISITFSSVKVGRT